MSVGEFLRQNRDTNGGGNFPGDFLAGVYNHVAAEQLTVG
jgi:Sec7-like guanine-nucleotide exchange factor